MYKKTKSSEQSDKQILALISVFRVIFRKAAQRSRLAAQPPPSYCCIFRTSSSPLYVPNPEPDFQLHSVSTLGGSRSVNEEKLWGLGCMLVLLCTMLIGAADLLFTIFPACKSTPGSQKFFWWPPGSNFLEELIIQVTPSFPEKISLFILVSLGS